MVMMMMTITAVEVKKYHLSESEDDDGNAMLDALSNVRVWRLDDRHARMAPRAT